MISALRKDSPSLALNKPVHLENCKVDAQGKAVHDEFAVVAVSWREIQVDTAGHSVTETGYFTGLAEYREGRWRFRDAHWSSPVSSR